MPKYVIEREIPSLGSLSDDEISAISKKSNSVLADLGGDVQWQQSYVTNLARVVRTIDPTTGGM
jgi:hypothetical protein